MIICKICGKECSDRGIGAHVKRLHKITPIQYYDKYYGKHKCLVCGKDTNFRSIHQGYLEFCSIKCADLERSVFKTRNPQKDPQIKQKTQKTCIERYGVSNPYQIDSVKTKCIANNHTKDALDKRTKSLYKNLENFCKANNCITMEEALKINPCTGWWSEVDFIIYKKWRKCISKDDLDIIKNYKPNNNRSKNEIKLYNLICANFNGTVEHSIRSIINPLELDIYIPDLKLAIEYNGCYYHSIEAGTSKDYHLEKSLRCRDLGIRLIHIYDFENFDTQCELVLKLLQGIDEFCSIDFNKNNLIEVIPNPVLILNDPKLHVYGAGKLYEI